MQSLANGTHQVQAPGLGKSTLSYCKLFAARCSMSSMKNLPCIFAAGALTNQCRAALYLDKGEHQSREEISKNLLPLNAAIRFITAIVLWGEACLALTENARHNVQSLFILVKSGARIGDQNFNHLGIRYHLALCFVRSTQAHCSRGHKVSINSFQPLSFLTGYRRSCSP